MKLWSRAARYHDHEQGRRLAADGRRGTSISNPVKTSAMKRSNGVVKYLVESFTST